MKMSKRKPSQNVEHRLTKLEEGLQGVRGDIAEVMSNVTNHIPTSIAAVKKDMDVLLDRKQNADAVKNFLNNCVKFAFSLASITWVVLQILKAIGIVHVS